MSIGSRFLPWVRATAAGANSVAMQAAGRSVSVALSTYGPGDVAGIATGQIRFRQPAPFTVGFPPNLFPYIEFNDPDFPWRVTPVGPNAAAQLSPWLALIVLEATDDSPVGNAAAGKLPVVRAKRAQLPPGAELALWAHAQIPSDVDATDDVIRRGFSRILSPRAMAPLTRYVACVVPVFEAARLAGLGQDPPDPLSAAPAWTDALDSVELPIYDYWFFTTAATGDFETLARQLRGRDISSGSSPLMVNVTAVTGAVDGNIAPLEGALRPLGSAASWNATAQSAAAAKLGSWMNREAASGPPAFGPPIYGSIQSGRTDVTSGWMADLNLDPRNRSAAGLGAAMVRVNQDDLSDEAWLQAGDLQRARREHSGALLADAATASLHSRYVAALAGPNALVTLAPALGLMRDTAAPNIAARLASSALPSAMVAPPFRRILRTKTPRAARVAGQVLTRTLPIQNDISMVPGAPPPKPARMFTISQLRTATIGSVVVSGGGVATTAHSVAADTHPAVTNVDITRFSSLLQLTGSQLSDLTAVAAQLDASPQVVQVSAPQPFAWVAPAPPPVTAMARFAIRIDLGDNARILGGSGVVTTPRFTEPLAAWLDPAYLMAGVNIPPDTAGLLEVNAPFVEALLVGANHELARELIWRGITLDASTTLLTRFFDSSGAAQPREIPAISTWNTSDALGSHAVSGERSVIVLRSRLVTHLSEALIYLGQAEPDGAFRRPGANQVLPVFRGVCGLDTAYFGFEIPPDQIAGSGTNLGWYFVIQEREGAPKFGLDELAPDPFTTWDQLGWPAVGLAGSYLSAAAKTPAPAEPGALKWGADAANMAAIFWRKPVRVSIHGSLLIPAS
jgi:hypothetical protein